MFCPYFVPRERLIMDNLFGLFGILLPLQRSVLKPWKLIMDALEYFVYKLDTSIGS